MNRDDVARVLHLNQEIDSKIEACKNYLHDHSGDVEIQYALADVLCQKALKERDIDHLKQGIALFDQISPKNSLYSQAREYRVYARCLLAEMTDDFAEKEEIYESLRKDGRLWEGFLWLVYLAEKRGDCSKAAQRAEEALNHDGLTFVTSIREYLTIPLARELWKVAQKRGTNITGSSEPIAPYSEVTWSEERNKNPFLHLYLAVQMPDSVGRKVLLEGALKAAKNNPTLEEQLRSACVGSEQKEIQDTGGWHRVQYQRILQYDPTNPVARIALARENVKQKNWEDAVQLYTPLFKRALGESKTKEDASLGDHLFAKGDAVAYLLALYFSPNSNLPKEMFEVVLTESKGKPTATLCTMLGWFRNTSQKMVIPGKSYFIIRKGLTQRLGYDFFKVKTNNWLLQLMQRELKPFTARTLWGRLL